MRGCRDTGSGGYFRSLSPVPAVSAVLILLLVLLVAPVSASVYIYNASGGGTVQDLINSTSGGDSVFLPGGMYYGNLIIDRQIILGALDDTDPPVIITDGSAPALTLDVDGITVTGVSITGNSSSAILVRSNNNRISDCTLSGFSSAIVLESATGNIFSGNTIAGNDLGVSLDRQSRSNIFYLNRFANTWDVSGPSGENNWFSGGQDYQYGNQTISGPLGNSWDGYTGTDSNGDGIGDTVYTLKISPSEQAAAPTAAESVDRAPLVGIPESYVLVRSGNESVVSPFDTRSGTHVFVPDGGQAASQQPQQQLQQQPGTLGPLTGPVSTGAPPPDSFGGLLLQYWWAIPVLIVIAAAGGIMFERYRKKHAVPPHPDPLQTLPSRNATIVTLPGSIGQPAPAAAQDHSYYTVHLPPLLERKYPDAEYLGEGGVGRVFRAWDQNENRAVAIKVPVRFDEVTGAQFTKELHIWQGLHHKNIVEIYAANVFPMPYIEMEYVDSSLASRKFPLGLPEAIRIIRGIADGLQYAHERGIVHRDIKPENVLLTVDGTPKITDWGLAKALADAKHTGVISFSLSYAAPEQLAPNIYGDAGPWTDIYQLGVVFYEMVAGHLPFSGIGMGEVTHAILHDTPSPPVVSGPGAEIISSIILTCIRKKPQERYRSITDLLEDLDQLDF